jgi:hypothetical protein
LIHLPKIMSALADRDVGKPTKTLPSGRTTRRRLSTRPTSPADDCKGSAPTHPRIVRHVRNLRRELRHGQGRPSSTGHRGPQARHARHAVSLGGPVRESLERRPCRDRRDVQLILQLKIQGRIGAVGDGRRGKRATGLRSAIACVARGVVGHVGSEARPRSPSQFSKLEDGPSHGGRGREQPVVLPIDQLESARGTASEKQSSQ